MSEIISTDSREMVMLDTLASEARLLTENIALNMLQLGRVLTEAKDLIRHGNWREWVERNCDISERYAQQFMAAWRRYGQKEGVERLGKSKILKLLALPEGKEDEFLQENNVEDMTAREVEAAVKRTRYEMQAEIDRERALRLEAEQREGTVPDEIVDEMRRKDNEIAAMRAEVDRLAGMGRENVTENNDLRRENARLMKELEEQNALNEEQQEDVRRAQSELLNLKSQIAKGDAERPVSGEMTLDAFAGAVRSFIGSCARMPHMGRAFSMMGDSQWNAWDELMQTVESWAAETRKAMNMIGGVSA